MNRENEKAMFASKKYNSGITKQRLLNNSGERDDLLIDEIRHGEMLGNKGKRFAHPYQYAKTEQELADYIKDEKKSNPNYDFELVNKEPYEGYHYKATQFNYNNIRQNELRKRLQKLAEMKKPINRAKASSEDKKINPNRNWEISLNGMFERNKAIKRWAEKNGYKTGIKSILFGHGMGLRNDDPKSMNRNKTESGKIPNIDTVIYWEDNATVDQKNQVQAILSKYFDMDLNAEHGTVATFGDADVRATKDWENKLGFDREFKSWREYDVESYR